MKLKVAMALGAGLLVLSGCSTKIEGNRESASMSTGTSTTAASKTLSAASASFCRDVNTAVNISQSPGTTLNEAQTVGMTTALQGASTGIPDDAPAGFVSLINDLLADLQAPTTSLPDSFSPNAAKLAQYAADYCG